MPSMSVTTSTTEGLPELAASVMASCKSSGRSNPDAEATHVFGQPGKVRVGEDPELVHVAGYAHAGVGPLVALLFLVQGVVIVDYGDGVDAVTYGGLHFAQVIPEPPVAGKADHRAVGDSALGAQRGGKGPAQGTGAAKEGLGGLVEVDHCAGPDARVAGIREQHSIIW